MRPSDPDKVPTFPVLDALLPDAVARKAEEAGVAKSLRDWPRLFALSILAGAFIAFGAMLATIVLAGSDGVVSFGIARLVAGLAFSLGLILVVVGGAELFTGDMLMVMAWASGRLPITRMLRAWGIIYVGNLVGALGTAVLIFLSGHHEVGKGLIAAAALAAASGKAVLPFFDVFVRGILANVLVCMAVWATLGGRTVADKVLVIVLPVAAFVAAGFEHSIANMYLLPYAWMIKAGASSDLWAMMGGSASEFDALTLRAMGKNLIAATAGNFVGGALLVGLVYWFIYLRR
jgi:formate transporter